MKLKYVLDYNSLQDWNIDGDKAAYTFVKPSLFLISDILPQP